MDAEQAKEIVLLQSTKKNIDTSQVVQGYDFNKGVDYNEIFNNYLNLGIQATHLYKSIDIVKKMLKTKEKYGDKMKIYLGISSNIISSGMRELVTFLCREKLIDIIVTTGGAIDADIMKCFGDYYVKDQDINEQKEEIQLNVCYEKSLKEKFDNFLNNIFDEICEKQNKYITPSELNTLIGKKLNNEESFLYQCQKNEIPIYAPAITDGFIGHLIYKRYLQKKENPKIDVALDIKLLNGSALFLKKSGMIIIGGGVIKHHIFNANLMRNGAEFAVIINTGLEYDASDSGAQPTEALTWGKIRLDAEYCKVFSEASLVFPILISESFYKYWIEKKDNQNYQIKQTYGSDETLWQLVIQKVVQVQR